MTTYIQCKRFGPDEKTCETFGVEFGPTVGFGGTPLGDAEEKGSGHAHAHF